MLSESKLIQPRDQTVPCGLTDWETFWGQLSSFQLEVSPRCQLCRCTRDAAQHQREDKRWGHQPDTSKGNLQAAQGWFQFRDPVPDLQATEKMRLVFFSQQKPGPITLHFQAGEAQKHLAIARHGVKGPQALGEGLGVCSFLLCWQALF